VAAALAPSRLVSGTWLPVRLGQPALLPPRLEVGARLPPRPRGARQRAACIRLRAAGL